jgi:ABC-type transport system substrate-binding protein
MKNASNVRSFCQCGLFVVGLLLSASLLADGMPALGAPRRGGMLRIARADDVQTLDPARVTSTIDSFFEPLLYQPLIDHVDGKKFINNLTASWSTSSDLRVYTFELLPGVRFSNGRESTAEDYVFTLERILDPNAACFSQFFFRGIKGAPEYCAARTAEADQSKLNPAFAKGRWMEPTRILGLAAPSRFTLVIELEKPDAAFPFMVAGLMAVARETLADPNGDVGVRPVGTGPYVVKEWIRGVRLRLERNSHYFRPEQQYFDAIEVFIGGDQTTHLMMFERGELDVAGLDFAGVPVADFSRLRQDSHWQQCWETTPTFSFIHLSLNTEMPPLNDVRVRQAIAHSINRTRWQRLNGGRVIPTHGPIATNMPGFNPALVAPAYDLDRARALLREAGYPDGITNSISFWHPTAQLEARWAMAIQHDLARAEIATVLHPFSSGAGDAITKRGGVPMFVAGYSPSIPDPCDVLGIVFHGKSIAEEQSLNVSFYNNPSVNKILDEAVVCANSERRTVLYQEAEQIVVDEAPFVFLGHPKFFSLHQPWLKGPLVDPIWLYRFDRVWIEK